MATTFSYRDVWLLAKRKAPQILWGLLVLSLLSALLFLAWRNVNKPVLVEYEGTIVERWAGYAETNEGSRPYHRLTIETGDDKRVMVRVDADTYNRAQVGMRIKKTASEIELFPGTESSPISADRRK